MLAAAAIPLFLFTRTMAAWNRESNVAAGRSWYERASEPLKQHNSVTAIEYLRKAAAADRNNEQYSLTLAEALDGDGQVEEARQILLRLRNSQPEDGRINLDLARISVKDDEVEIARKYYHQALYGMWPAGQVEPEQSRIRMELVRFLLSQQDISNAVSELLILAAYNPSDTATKAELGLLFLQADEPNRALNQFLDVLKLEPTSTIALAGAGEAEFRSGNDEAAKRWLQSAAQQGPLSAEAQHTLDLAGLILSGDALANGIDARERVRRLTQSLMRASDRLDTCGIQSALSDPGAAETLKEEIKQMLKQVGRQGAGADLNLLRDGLRIASSAELAGTKACGPLSAPNEAIVLAAKRHKLNTP